MKRLSMFINLLAAMCISNTLCGAPFPSPGDTLIVKETSKRAFFITPFYQFTSFQDLRLIANTNNYLLWQGQSAYEFTAEEIQEYNDHFSTAYHSSITGIKIGYQIFSGLGISAYAGVNHLSFESWISKDGNEKITTDYPALNLGIAVDYQKKITNRLITMAMLTFNHSKTRSVMIENLSGEPVLSAQLSSMFYELNIGLFYKLGKLVPYAGAGFSQHFINPVVREQILTEDDSGLPYYNITEFDSHIRGAAIYAFAGMEYFFNKNLSIYLRAAFPNPVMASYGIRVII